MAALNERQIDDMVKELVEDVLQPIEVSKKETTEEVAKEAEQQNVKGDDNKDTETKPSPDINKMINGLFTNLVDSFIPQEFKQNKDVNKMMSLLMTSFNSVGLNSSTKETKETQSKEDESEDQTEEDEDQTEEDEDQTEEDESEDQTEEDEDQTDEDDLDDYYTDSDSQELNNNESVFVVLHNNKPLGYANSFKKAKNYMIYLYNKFMFSNMDSFLRTERTRKSIQVYEREPFTIFPFSEKMITTFNITSVSPL